MKSTDNILIRLFFIPYNFVKFIHNFICFFIIVLSNKELRSTLFFTSVKIAEQGDLTSLNDKFNTTADTFLRNRKFRIAMRRNRYNRVAKKIINNSFNKLSFSALFWVVIFNHFIIPHL